MRFSLSLCPVALLEFFRFRRAGIVAAGLVRLALDGLGGRFVAAVEYHVWAASVQEPAGWLLAPDGLDPNMRSSTSDLMRSIMEENMSKPSRLYSINGSFRSYPQADTVPQVVHAEQVILPMVVDHLQEQHLFQVPHEFNAEFLLFLVVGAANLGLISSISASRPTSLKWSATLPLP